MKTKEAISLFQTHQRSSHRKRTLQSYLAMLNQFKVEGMPIRLVKCKT